MKEGLNKKRKKKGFTLIELIIVLAIMSIIAAIAIPSLNGVKENAKAKADERSSDVISRSITVLVADETIPEGSVGTIKITPEHGTGTSKTTNVIAELKVANVDIDSTKKSAIERAVENALRDIKRPQSSNKSIFVVSLRVGEQLTTVPQ